MRAGMGSGAGALRQIRTGDVLRTFRDELQSWPTRIGQRPARYRSGLGSPPRDAPDHLLIVQGEGEAGAGWLAVIAAHLRNPVELEFAEAQAVRC